MESSSKMLEVGIISLLILSGLFSISLAQAKQKIGFNAYLQPSNPKIKDTITIKLEIVNPTNYRIKLPHLTLRYEVIYEGPGDPLNRYDPTQNKIQGTEDISGDEIILEPRGKYECIFFPEEYNKRDKENRIGKWTINLELIPSSFSTNYIEYYDEETRHWGEAYWLELEKISNPIEFKIEKPITQPPPQNLLEVLFNGLKWWFTGDIIRGTLSGIIITVIGGLILNKLTKKK